ncbi:MAG: 30S ribosomal protein S18 [Acidobacteriota bacterium]
MSSERNDRSRQGGGQGGGGRRFVRARKSCKFCAEKIDYIDYKDARLLSSFIPERGKIQPRRISGTCSIHQRMLAAAIKRGRNAAILPFATD